MHGKKPIKIDTKSLVVVLDDAYQMMLIFSSSLGFKYILVYFEDGGRDHEAKNVAPEAGRTRNRYFPETLQRECGSADTLISAP